MKPSFLERVRSFRAAHVVMSEVVMLSAGNKSSDSLHRADTRQRYELVNMTSLVSGHGSRWWLPDTQSSDSYF